MTPDEINAKLAENPRWVEWAVEELYKLQTPTEQAWQTTAQHNGRGFNAVDAPFLSSLAEQLGRSRKPKGYRLTPRQQAAARKCLGKYIRTQLVHLPDPRTNA